MTFFFQVMIVLFHCIRYASTYSINDALRKPMVFPVLHNLKSDRIPQVLKILQDRAISSISLRNEYSMDTILQLLRERENLSISKENSFVGASTIVSERQIQTLSTQQIDFFSTIHYSKALLETSGSHKIPMFCAVRNLADCQFLVHHLQTLSDPANHCVTMKIYPIRDIGKQEFIRMMDLVDSALHQSGIPLQVIVSGGITATTPLEELIWYLDHGVTNVAVGYDCNHAINQLASCLQVMDEKLLQAKRYVLNKSFREKEPSIHFHANRGVRRREIVSEQYLGAER